MSLEDMSAHIRSGKKLDDRFSAEEQMHALTDSVPLLTALLESIAPAAVNAETKELMGVLAEQLKGFVGENEWEIRDAQKAAVPAAAAETITQ